MYLAPYFKMWYVYYIVLTFNVLVESQRQQEKFHSALSPVVLKVLNNLIRTLFPDHIYEHVSPVAFHIP